VGPFGTLAPRIGRKVYAMTSTRFLARKVRRSRFPYNQQQQEGVLFGVGRKYQTGCRCWVLGVGFWVLGFGFWNEGSGRQSNVAPVPLRRAMARRAIGVLPNAGCRNSHSNHGRSGHRGAQRHPRHMTEATAPHGGARATFTEPALHWLISALGPLGSHPRVPVVVETSGSCGTKGSRRHDRDWETANGRRKHLPHDGM
jgi:hypothetical protein